MAFKMEVMGRGLLIVLEGCDRSGKTTICKRLVSDLQAIHKMEAIGMRFPDRYVRTCFHVIMYKICETGDTFVTMVSLCTLTGVQILAKFWTPT